MIDFNDPQPSGSPGRDAERDAIRAELLERLESVLFTLYPAGKKRRGRFLIGDILGSPGDSLEVVLDGDKAGLWTDRADNSGGDVFALIGGYHGISVHTDFARVLEHAGDLVGRARAAPVRKAKAAPPTDDLGPATAKWDYLDATGKLIAVVYRYDPPRRKKEFRPWDAKRRKMVPPEPRPLYNQPGLLGASQVVLVEGEKCAEALIGADVAATTAMHGANAPVDKTDWSPLAGKSVFVNVITTILGDYAANAPMGTFMEARTDRHPTDLAGLRGVRFVSSIETEQGRRWNESKVKSITGGDKVSARFMRQDFFEYVPQFKLVIAGNHKPSIRNVDEAMKRRLHLILFTVTIPLEKRDGRLTEKLLKERDGILASQILGNVG